MTLVIGTPPRAVADGVVVIPLASRNVLSLHAIWMESNPNPVLKALLDIVHAVTKPDDSTRAHRQ